MLMLCELDFTGLLKKKKKKRKKKRKIQQILNTHHYVFVCFPLYYYYCSPQGYDASVKKHHYVLPRLFFNFYT